MQEYTVGKDNLFNKWYWKNWSATCRRIKLDYFLTPYTIINSKWIKDLNIIPETIKLLEENIDSMLFVIGPSNFFLYVSSHKGNRAKINKWNYIKLKSFCTEKETINKMKRHPIEWEKIFAHNISDKGLTAKIDKELIQHNMTKTNSLIKKKMGRGLA